MQGYTTWEGLKKTNLEAGGKFILCPGSTLNATSGRITLDGSFVTIQCGPNGHKGEKCVIEGGTRQFDVLGEGAKFHGKQEDAIAVGLDVISVLVCVDLTNDCFRELI